MCALLSFHMEVSHPVVLLTSAQGQTLFVRLKTHLICREEHFQLSFKAVAQLWRGSATSHGDVLWDTLATHLGVRPL